MRLAAEQLVERLALELPLDVPQRHVERRVGEAGDAALAVPPGMRPHLLPRLGDGDLAGILEQRAEAGIDQRLGRPAGLRPHGDALAPANHAVHRLDPHQHRLAQVSVVIGVGIADHVALNLAHAHGGILPRRPVRRARHCPALTSTGTAARSRNGQTTWPIATRRLLKPRTQRGAKPVPVSDLSGEVPLRRSGLTEMLVARLLGLVTTGNLKPGRPAAARAEARRNLRGVAPDAARSAARPGRARRHRGAAWRRRVRLAARSFGPAGAAHLLPDAARLRSRKTLRGAPTDRG